MIPATRAMIPATRIMIPAARIMILAARIMIPGVRIRGRGRGGGARKPPAIRQDRNALSPAARAYRPGPGIMKTLPFRIVPAACRRSF
jgi:hypothetical protein